MTFDITLPRLPRLPRIRTPNISLRSRGMDSTVSPPESQSDDEAVLASSKLDCSSLPQARLPWIFWRGNVSFDPFVEEQIDEIDFITASDSSEVSVNHEGLLNSDSSEEEDTPQTSPEQSQESLLLTLEGAVRLYRTNLILAIGGLPSTINILSFDADGFRGIASLEAAIKIMGYINSGRKANDELLPHQVFQVVSGAELGGIIAILLVVFKMTAQEALVHFVTFCEVLYDLDIARQKARNALCTFGKDIHKYSPEPALAYISSLCMAGFGELDVPFVSTKTDCHALVSFASIRGTDEPNQCEFVTSFPDNSSRMLSEVVRIAIATPGIVRPFVEKKSEFTSGATSFPDPSHLAWDFAHSLYGQGTRVQVLRFSAGMIGLNLTPTGLKADLILKCYQHLTSQDRMTSWNELERATRQSERHKNSLMLVSLPFDLRLIKGDEIRLTGKLMRHADEYFADEGWDKDARTIAMKVFRGYHCFQAWLSGMSRPPVLPEILA